MAQDAEVRHRLELRRGLMLAHPARPHLVENPQRRCSSTVTATISAVRVPGQAEARP